MKVTSLSLEQLDYWVAKASSIELTPSPDGANFLYAPHASMALRKWSPTRYWSQGGPIMEDAHIDLNWDWEESGEWTASIEPDINAQGKSILEAAMKAFIISRLGEDVE